ncbi:MAG: EAL domain-containing protein [Candidatus Thiodiazotropha lotti]|uniref:EAL domain-containing protein n=1 Tax=Candidatus Thiodiazotropha lotti TaxID=2792787 RepID=A0A9E4N0W1_9GAMM|nr:EAL domain-containing protein [Candidatus Thiodiazotropha lotti]MCG7920476.1 EAL domain-containing protein [Candidatus Thiodiazotropha lotti]MCG7932534.1 EAL domain-containing protein [Candidatus Thiodiazotropha lotti]MCG7938959.1 EAL domain-containing protein [Candidatus Thiodiazotropha lotti]MCG7988088.1 EAL domain-containing protein [Candidatus Thiodiazotropha lotti]
MSDILQDENDVAIAKAIISMATNLSLDVLAEGIETEDQLKFLLQQGCKCGQGFYFARPMPAPELEAFMS